MNAKALVERPGALERRRGSLTDETRATFLEALAQAYSVTHAAAQAGLSRQTLYATRKDDEEFAAAWAEAIETGTQVLEDELRRRAFEGWTEDTHDGEGKLVRRVQRISPQDLHFQLKARRPEVYRDNAQMTQVAVHAGVVDARALAEGVKRFEDQVARHRSRVSDGEAGRALQADVVSAMGELPPGPGNQRLVDIQRLLEIGDEVYERDGAEQMAASLRRHVEGLVGGPDALETLIEGEAKP